MGEVLARPARGADVGALHRSHAGVVERALRSRPPVELSAAACTWRFIANRPRSAPTASHNRLRFCSTFAGSSSVSRPRLSDAYGPTLTPPFRVGNATT